MVKMLFFILLLVGVSSKLQASTLLGRQFGLGDLQGSYEARQRALGNTHLASQKTASAIFSNPAQLGGRARFNFVVGQPIALRYEKAIHSDESETFNEHSEFSWNFPLVALSFSGKYWSLGIGWSAYSDFNYSYKEEDFSNGHRTSLKEVLDQGEIRSFASGIALPLKKISVGVGGLLYHGNPSFSYQDLSFHPQTGAILSSDIQTSQKKFQGYQILAGLSAPLRANFRVGMVMKSASFLNETEDRVAQGVWTQTQRKWTLPWEYGMGVEYVMVPSGLATTFRFDIIQRWWGQTHVVMDGKGKEDTGFVDTLSYHFGIEHYLKPFLPIRFGGSIEPFYGREGADSFTVSLGGGYHWSLGSHWLSFDIAGEYRMLSSVNVDRLFPEPEDPDFPFLNQDVMDTYTQSLICSITYHF
jgi:hypothetical protein